MKTTVPISIFVAGGLSAFFSGCGNGASTASPYTGPPGSAYDTSTTEVVSAAIAQAASASDNGGSVVALLDGPRRLPLGLRLLRSISKAIMPEAVATSNCSTSEMVQGTACTGGSSLDMTITLGGCKGEFGTWAGIASLAFDSAGTCTLANTGGLTNMAAGNTMTLTSAAGLTLTSTATSYYVEEDSSSSGYGTAQSGGIEITCGAGGCATLRTVQILGLHRALFNASATKLYDHTINTTTSLSITGTGTSKRISAGVIQLQHNLDRFTATSTVGTAITFSANCCLPTGGTVTTVFSGSKSGSETTTFTSNCGVAKVNNESVNLAYCE